MIDWLGAVGREEGRGRVRERKERRGERAFARALLSMIAVHSIAIG
jgi:hypothetical protein